MLRYDEGTLAHTRSRRPVFGFGVHLGLDLGPRTRRQIESLQPANEPGWHNPSFGRGAYLGPGRYSALFQASASLREKACDERCKYGGGPRIQRSCGHLTPCSTEGVVSLAWREREGWQSRCEDGRRGSRPSRLES